MKIKKVAVFVSLFPSISETFIVNEITTLIHLGYQIKIFTRVKKALGQGSQSQLITKYKLLEKTLQYLPILPTNKFSKLFSALFLLIKNPQLSRVFRKSLSKSKYYSVGSSLKLWFQVIAFQKLEKADLYHAHFAVNGVHLSRMTSLKILKIPYGITFYGFDAHPINTAKPKVKKEYAAMFASTKFVMVGTNYLKQKVELLGCPVNKIHVIPVGIDTTYFVPLQRERKDTLRLVSVGRLIELKGHSYGIEAVSQLVKKGINVHYTIVGYGNLFETLSTQIKHLKLQDHVVLVGKKTQDEIKNIFTNSDVFLMTSITDSTGRAEVQGLVTIEAQATGMPVVAFDSGGVADTLIDKQTGFLVPEKDANAMANKVLYFAQNRKSLSKMGDAASSFVKSNFDTLVLAQKISTLYQS